VQLTGAIEPLTQKNPEEQFSMVLVVGQYEPAGHGGCMLTPAAGQYEPEEQLI
jgi:hypothetical protein